MNHTFVKNLKVVLVTTLTLLTSGNALAQETPQTSSGTGVVVKGSVYGGGNAADVKVNTTVNMSTGTVEGNVYGGGNLGDVGTIVKNADYNYTWTDNTAGNNTITGTNNNTGVCTVTITDGTIGNGTFDEDHGNVFGGGKGVANSFWCEKGMVYATSVSISKGTVNGNVYGGGQVGRVEDDTKVTIGAPTGTDEFEIKGNVFGAGAGFATHGYSALVRGNSLVTVQGKAKVKKSVYGGGEIASVGKFKVENSVPTKPLSGGTCTVVIQDDAKIGTGDEGGEVFGACKGVTPAYTSTTVHWMNDNQPHTFSGENAVAEYLAFLKTLALTSNTIVTIDGNATVNGSVFGGGQRGVALGTVAVNITGGTVTSDVYGGGALADTNTGNWHADYGEVAGLTTGDIVTGYYTRSGAGTEESPYVYTEITAANTPFDAGTTYYSINTWAHVVKESALYTTTVRLLGGSVRNVYGGGLGQIDGEDGATGDIEAYVYGDVKVNLNGLAPAEYNAATYGTLVSGNSTSSPDYYVSNTGCKVNGDVFGCNNKKGTPKGSVTVNVYKTVTRGSSYTHHVNAVYGGGNLAAYLPINSLIDIRKKEGNNVLTNADGSPQIDEDKKTIRDAVEATVEIFGCDNVIETVYGGGNAASTPANHLIIHGGTFKYVYGGGNGAGDNNPGANVGYKGNLDNTTKEQRQNLNNSYIYGSGVATTDVYGGTIDYLFGGSNSKGNIREVAVAMLDGSADACTFDIGEAYGGGRAAPMDGVARLDMRCVPKMGAVFGGAQQADVDNDVELNITSGFIGQVFGGNNLGGRILGSITVNVEESTTSCHPIIIGELYGGGKEAGYSIYGYKKNTSDEWIPIESADDTNALTGDNVYDNPKINVKSFTSIGNVYGGGLEALMVGSPQVNINVVEGGKKDVIDGYPKDDDNNDITKINGFDIPPHAEGAIGAINNVFGGGNKAKVIGDTEVNIGYVEEGTGYESANIVQNVYGGGNAANVDGNTVINFGFPESTKTVKVGGSIYGGCNTQGTINGDTHVNILGGTIGVGTLDLASTPKVYTLTTKGNVFGGGYGKDTYVKGSVEVNIGKATTTTTTTPGANEGDDPVVTTTTTYSGDAEIFGDVYGGGALGHVNGEENTATNATIPITPTSGKTTTVNLIRGTIFGDAYGGGLGQKTGFDGATSDYAAYVGGDVNLYLDGAAFIIDKENTTDKDPDDQTKYIQALKSGRVFGCNNLNGYPLGDVTVTVNQTVEGNVARSTTPDKTNDNATYEVAAVYGGGNLANYAPTKTGAKASVIINSCDVSIQEVYGGGNAAAVPGTDVLVKGAYEIHQVFGGGNGKDKYKQGTTWVTNPGADVNGTAGTVSANTLLLGGVIHEAYGGSNEKGTITGSVTIDSGEGGLESCQLDLGKMAGAGKNADVYGGIKMIMGCKPSSITPILYCGADNANVWGDVEVTITSGNFGQVFGGNNLGGAIFGQITLNIEETGECDTPINIDQLYLGGNQAAYSKYGYYVETTTSEGDNATGVGAPSETAVLINEKLHFIPRDSLNDTHLPVKSCSYNETSKKWEWVVWPLTGTDKFTPYEEPVLNIISCTSIGEVFGGGYGVGGDMYANPTVNINMIPGSHAEKIKRSGSANAHDLGEIGDVYGGGDAADVYGNTTINIGTEETVNVKSWNYDPTTKEYTAESRSVEGAYITGNVYGGGKLANVGKYHTDKDADDKTIDVIDIKGSTSVNICAVRGTEILEQGESTGRYNYTSRSFTATGASGVTILENVYGGGKGEAEENDDVAGAFRCGKAMVTESTSVAICNGTVSGDVFGGGEKGRVEENTVVTIGSENDTNSAPVINGDVFGAGAGVNTHGYSALVRGNSYVTVQGEAKVKRSVYGGGEIASVGKYNIDENGMPQSLANQGSGYCYVTVRDNAVIGPDEAMIMTRTGYPDDMGHVFGAGKGVLPYEGYEHNETAWRMAPNDKKQYYLKQDDATDNNEGTYLKYVETLGLATQTYVTIDENAFVKGSVYGGSENGYVQHHTQVNIKGNCQIGNGYAQMTDDGVYLDKLSTPVTPIGVNRRYTDDEWTAGHLIPDQTKEPELYALVNTKKYYTSSLPECASWTFGQAADAGDRYAPWDKFASTTGYDSKGGRTTADDGHTFYGNVFGGGSGLIPYRPGKWHPEAGSVGGNTEVNITGGHILTNVYGGNELTDVYGKCTVNFGGTATLGVPRTLGQIDAHPLTCYLFGAGKGDQRVLFNKSTNVENVEVKVTGGRIYGSIFGGGEDGHVHRDVNMTIEGSTTKIGTWGTSYVDGNVFGAGRGFGADAYTAGNVGGSVTMEIKAGEILGSVYGGGRLGSVGYGLFEAGASGYGEMRPDNTVEESNPTSADNFKRGYIDITISGGTIGNNYEYIIPSADNAPDEIKDKPISEWTTTSGGDWDQWKKHNNIPKTLFEYDPGRNIYMLTHTRGGNVFAGGMGRRLSLDNTPITGIDWLKLGNAKSTTLTISGDAVIKSNVYGGGELGAVIPYTNGSLIQGGTTEIDIQGGTIGQLIGTGTDQYTFGSVYGGGMGDETNLSTYTKIGGSVQGSTKITMSAGTVMASVFGGGELATVEGSHTAKDSEDEDFDVGTEINISGTAKIGYKKEGFGGATMGNVYGGGKGSLTTANAGLIKKNTLVKISGTPEIYHNIYGGGAYGSVGTFDFTTGGPTNWTDGTGKAEVIIDGGTIGINGHENGMIFGSSRGDVAKPEGNPAVDPNDKLAWVYDTHVVVGSTNGNPSIYGTVYGSGENGHTYHNTLVDIHKGTIGIANSSDVANSDITVTNKDNTTTTYKGAAYPYRGNVYGGGCGTDMYDSDGDGEEDTYNPLAGIVRGNATINVNGGHIVHNVYGAGAMGSVGTATTGGQTTINISDGTIIGVSGTVEDGNVFGAARGALDATGNDLALVSGNTSVSITGGTVKGNVYGGGELGYVGIFTSTTDQSNGSKTYTWTKGGICNVTIDNEASVKGHVFGAGKGSAETYECEPAMVYKTNVSISKGAVDGNVYGGGQLGRVENNTTVTIGTASGTDEFEIKGNVFGAGAGVATHGYSALVRGNATVTVQGKAKVGKSVYGGGETASVGKFKVVNSLPKEPLSGGTCTVTIQDDAEIGTAGDENTGHVFGACKGVEPDFAHNAGHWMNDNHSHAFEGENAEAEYLSFLKTLALTSNTVVTIGGNASINGSVFGGGQRGITLGSVKVDMIGGTVVKDIYGGGALADTNTGNASNYGTSSESISSTSTYTTTVNLLGGEVNDVYGGGLGQKVGDVNGGTSDVEAIVYGDVNVNLNGLEVSDYVEEVYGELVSGFDGTDDDTTIDTYRVVNGGCTVTGNVFGCNNINGTPLGHSKVHVFKTVPRTGKTYDVDAVFGGGNNADYTPVDSKQSTEVIIEGCELTSIEQVYGGGNAAATPGSSVLVKGTKIINELFGGGNGERGAAFAANVGYHYNAATETRTNYTLGEGKAIVQTMAGTINYVYGGSNSHGDIRGGATTTTPANDYSAGCCDELKTIQISGGGKNADMESGADIIIDCRNSKAWVEEIYAGAENANVGGNVRLTITSGKFGRVFGGNKTGGKLNGSITVNIEENPACGIPVIIGELYAGGNKAPYSIYGYDSDGKPLTSSSTPVSNPVVNVRAFTSIGNIFGGGFGENAIMYGSPTVNINSVEVNHTDSDTEFEGNQYSGETHTIKDDPNDPSKNYDVYLYPHDDGKMGVIGNVFGGGNAAKVVGNTNVNIGTKATDIFHTPVKKTVHNTETNKDEEVDTTDEDRTHNVAGADIRGNVYGGGNSADVTGKTNVTIGQEETTTP